jgi:hypothetical protein
MEWEIIFGLFGERCKLHWTGNGNMIMVPDTNCKEIIPATGIIKSG